jgi:hypothetical protein
MAKLFISSDEEMMYMHQLVQIQELMPDIEILIEDDRPIPKQMLAFASDTGKDFRAFLSEKKINPDKDLT